MEKNNYHTRAGIECLNSCIYNYLANENQAISRSDIFFSGGGFEIGYFRGNGHKIMSGQNRSNLQFIRTYLEGSTVDNVLETYEGEMKTFLKETLQNKNRLIINVSGSGLPYSKAFDSNQTVSHFINLIGIDTKKNLVRISDGCMPVVGGGCYEDWIDMDVLAENWQMMNGRYIELNYKHLDIQKIKKSAYENMRKGIKKYLHKDRGWFGSRIGGHQAILRLFEDIKMMIESNTKNSLEIIRDINQQLRVEGYLSSKEFLLEKMKETGCREELTDSYQHIIREYDIICLNVMKSVIKKNPENMEGLIKQIQHSVQQENKILKEVLRNPFPVFK
ncbi:MAG: hypothetical protein HFI34_04395 [Lachnospiraceae bacterium]|nr:hypothetical protein [Lachnospiraceae bacterium]